MLVLFIENKYFEVSVCFPRHESYCYLLVHIMRDSQKIDLRRKKKLEKKIINYLLIYKIFIVNYNLKC